jgi:TIR domain
MLRHVAKVFFCYASEDRETVDAVYAALVAKHDIWIDRYEIVGGESLIGKISEGIDQADKFFVFLSEVSVNKPWVQSELRDALADEIAGIRPDFVVPVLLRKLSEIPRFLKDKLYVDLSGMTQDEWVSALDAAITGTPARPEGAGSDNLLVTKEHGSGDHIALVRFEPKAWAEKLCFIVETSEDMVQPEDGPGAISDLLDNGTIGLTGVRYNITGRIAALCAQSDVQPGEQITFKIEFPEGVDALGAIASAGRWQPA